MSEETSIANTEPAAGQTDNEIIDVVAKDASTEEQKDAEPKVEKTAHELRIEELEREQKRMQRGIDRRTRQLSDARAQLNLTNTKNGSNYEQSTDDSEPLSLTRAQIQEMVIAEAKKLAPTLQEQATEAERKQSVVQSLTKTWGAEKFDEISTELDEIFSGLIDANGFPKPAVEAIFESDAPAKVLEYLTDPDNVDEAERISRMDAVRAGIAIAKLEARLSEKPKPTQKASKAPAPLESLRGKGSSGSSDLNDDLSPNEWLERRNKQLRDRYI